MAKSDDETFNPAVDFKYQRIKNSEDDQTEKMKCKSVRDHIRIQMLLLACIALAFLLVLWLMMEFQKPIELREKILPSIYEYKNEPFSMEHSRKILIFNDRVARDDWGIGTGNEPFVAHGCRVQNCFLTTDKNSLGPGNISYFDAILFNLHNLTENVLNFLPHQRRNFQRYVFFLKHPVAKFRQPSISLFDNYFNWSMTYRSDSDLPDPPGRIIHFDKNKHQVKEHHRLVGFNHDAHLSPYVHHTPGSLLHKEKLVCYYGIISASRPKPSNLEPDEIDPFLCSHIIYYQVGYSDRTNQIVSRYPILDIDKGGFQKMTSLKSKNRHLKVLVSLGMRGKNPLKVFSDIGKDRQKRENFAAGVVEFLQKYNFDGVDLDWKLGQEQDTVDKDKLSALADELKTAFDHKGFILSAAFSPKVDFVFDYQRLGQILDFFNIFAFDMHGHWETTVDHHSPMKIREFEKTSLHSTSVESTLHQWTNKGIPKSKIIVGIPLYGRSFLLEDPNNFKPGSPVRAKGTSFEGPFTKEFGLLAYFEICQMIHDDTRWTVEKDDDRNVYAYNGPKWVGYETPESVQRKVAYLKSEGYGGVMAWSLDHDDFNGNCGQKWPLLKTVMDELSGRNSKLAAWYLECNGKYVFQEKYVNHLKKFFPIDIYGECGEFDCPSGTFNEKFACTRELSKQYKFILTFEHFICKDFMTDYFFFVMTLPTVPIVFGHADYSKIAPKGSYIDVSDYSTTIDLAQHLTKLIENPNEYEKMFQWKEDHKILMRRDPICGLCEMLHSDLPAKTYRNLTAWVLDGSQCLNMMQFPWLTQE